MKTKISLILITFLALLFFPNASKAQDEMDFEEFMGMMSETLTESQLDELSYQLPWDIKVTAYAYGDFSEHGLNDFVLAIKEKNVTPPGTVDVYFFENLGDTTYKLIEKKNYEYYDISMEVAFLVQYGECFVTNRDNNNWYFTSYKIDNDNSLTQVSREVFPMGNKEKAGK